MSPRRLDDETTRTDEERGPIDPRSDHGADRTADYGAADAVVVGGGIVGVSSALYLQRTGRAVTLVERGSPGSGASGHNGGVINVGECLPTGTPGVLRSVPRMLTDPMSPMAIRYRDLPHLAPWLVRFALASRAREVERISLALKRLTDRAMDGYLPLVRGNGAERHVCEGGMLYTYVTDDAFAGDRFGIALRERRGDVFTVLDGAGVATLDESLAGRFRHALHRPTARFTPDPLAFTTALADQFVAAGGVLARASVEGFERGGRRVRAVLTTRGRIPTDHVVIAAGAWSGELVRGLGSRIPLRTERGYGVLLPDPGVTVKLPMVVADFHLGVRQTPGGMQLAGLDELARVGAPPNYRLTERMLRGARTVFPELNTAGATRWMHCRPSTPDSLPVIGPAPRYDNVHLAFGHGHKGLCLGGITGKIVGELVDGRPTGLDMAPYRPTRFAVVTAG